MIESFSCETEEVNQLAKRQSHVTKLGKLALVYQSGEIVD